MGLNLQYPDNPEALTLHEVLVSLCRDSSSGGGAFAFASRAGVDLFLRDDSFLSFLNSGPYRLIVGFDDLTDDRVLEALDSLMKQYPNLRASAFLGSSSGSLFHPKFCWFIRPAGGGVLVVGSGNLTSGGLRGNWEAFTVDVLGVEQMRAVEEKWQKWLDANAKYIRPLGDESVIARAKENRRRRKSLRAAVTASATRDKVPAIAGAVDIADEEGVWGFHESSAVLLREIPRGGNRWNQANFDLRSFVDFFGANPKDNNQIVVLRSVQEDGALGRVENRPSVTVRSRNFRLELSAASGKTYPTSGRPVAIFIKSSTRMFLYALEMPSSPAYREVDAFLSANWRGRKDRMRTAVSLVSALRAGCPSLQFWRLSIDDTDSTARE